MPLGRAIPFITMALLALSGCASVLPAPAPTQVAAVAEPVVAPAPTTGPAATARMPREIRVGGVDMVIQAVEPEVSREEVAAAIAPLLANAPVCLRWPALWMEQTRRSTFVVRYDMMVRDWGEGSASAARARMQEFVDLGFMTASPSADPNVVLYTLTEAGLQYLNGVLEPGRRPRFCAPAERQLVQITNMEWGRYPCGSLRVQFTHVSNSWPSWARASTTRARLEANWPANGSATEGTVSLSRQWYQRSALPAGFQNGMLRSLCYDASREQVTGNDLTLALGDID